MIIQQFLLACWAVFLLYWLVSARSVKPIERTSGWLGGNAYVIPLLIGFALLVNLHLLVRLGLPVQPLEVTLLPRTAFLNILSAVLTLGGLVVAIAARRTLAGNWSREVAIKEDHELIKTGLYRYVRHPIYSGILLMVLGTALSSDNLLAAAGFLVIALAICIKLVGEEHVLADHFGSEYADYKQHSRALIPFLW